MSESQTTATDLDVAEAAGKAAAQPATQDLILAELKAIRVLLEGGEAKPLLVEVKQSEAVTPIRWDTPEIRGWMANKLNLAGLQSGPVPPQGL